MKKIIEVKHAPCKGSGKWDYYIVNVQHKDLIWEVNLTKSEYQTQITKESICDKLESNNIPGEILTEVLEQIEELEELAYERGETDAEYDAAGADI